VWIRRATEGLESKPVIQSLQSATVLEKDNGGPVVKNFFPLLFLVYVPGGSGLAQQQIYETRTLTTITNKQASCSPTQTSPTCLVANIAQATAKATINSAGAVVPALTSPGGGYIYAPAVTVTGVTCSVNPVLTTTIQSAPSPLNAFLTASGGWGIVTGVSSGGSGCTGTPNVTIAAPGPGNMTRLRFSVQPGTNSNRWICDSSIQFIVDGTTHTAPLGIMFNTYATGPCGGAPQFMGTTPRFQITELSSGAFAGQIGFMIPFNHSLQVNYVPYVSSSGASQSATGTGLLWSQVDYYTGAIPTGVYPRTDQTFHMNLIPLGTTVNAYNSIDLLPVVSGAGRLNSIQLLVQMAVPSGQGPSFPFLEGLLPVYLDGVPWAYNGTEDAFCGSGYFLSLPGFFNGPDSCGVTALGPFGVGLLSADMFRFFDSNPMIFNKSLRVSWNNGMSGAGSYNPGQVTIAALVTYYTNP